MKKSSLSIILVLTVLMSTALFGCGTASTGDTAATGSTAAVASTAAPASTEAPAATEVNISILGHQSRDQIGKAGFCTGFFNSLDAYTAANPLVKVTYQGLDQTNYQTKINALAAADDMPDLFMLKGSWTKTFVDNGWVTDITNDLNADTAWKDGYIKGGFDNATVDGKIYGVPQESMTTSLIFYNADMWSSIGYSKFPATWTELNDAVAKFKAKGITTFVMGNKANWPAESDWLSTLGDRATGTAWTNSILSKGGAKFTDPDFIFGLKTFQDLAKAGAFNADINSLDDSEQNTVYFNKKAAAICTGTWFIPMVDSTAPADVKAATHLAILPSLEGGKGDANAASGGPAWFLSLSNKVTGDNADKYKAASALLKTLTDNNQADITASLGGVTAWADPTYDKSKASPLFNEYNDLIKNVTATPIYDASMDSSVIQTMNVGLQELLINATTPEKLADQIQKQQDIVNLK